MVLDLTADVQPNDIRPTAAPAPSRKRKATAMVTSTKMPRSFAARRTRRAHARSSVAASLNAVVNSRRPLYLQRRKVSEKTRKKYEAAHDKFATWCANKRLPLDTPYLLDQAMNKYVHSLFFAGEGPYTARMAIFGCIHVRGLNSRDPRTLPDARQAQ